MTAPSVSLPAFNSFINLSSASVGAADVSVDEGDDSSLAVVEGDRFGCVTTYLRAGGRRGFGDDERLTNGQACDCYMSCRIRYTRGQSRTAGICNIDDRTLERTGHVGVASAVVERDAHIKNCDIAA